MDQVSLRDAKHRNATKPRTKVTVSSHVQPYFPLPPTRMHASSLSPFSYKCNTLLPNISLSLHSTVLPSLLLPFLDPSLTRTISQGLRERGKVKMGRKPCCAKVGLKKGPWSPDEDKKLLDFLLNNPLCCWRLVPKLAGLLRCGKSCRLRWLNYLRPDLKRGLLSESEEKLVIDLHAQLGNRWSKIAAQLPGRTDNDVKNIWNTYIKKKLTKMGIDPTTHKPFSPSENPSDNSHGVEEEEEKTPTVSLCSDSEKSLTSSSVSSSSASSSSSSNSTTLVKDEALEEALQVPAIDWDEPMWLLGMEDFNGLELFSVDFDENLCF